MHLEIFENRTLFGGEGNQPTELDSNDTPDSPELIDTGTNTQDAPVPFTINDILFGVTILPVVGLGCCLTGVAIPVLAYSPCLIQKIGWLPVAGIAGLGVGGVIASSALLGTVFNPDWLHLVHTNVAEIAWGVGTATLMVGFIFSSCLVCNDGVRHSDGMYFPNNP